MYIVQYGSVDAYLIVLYPIDDRVIQSGNDLIQYGVCIEYATRVSHSETSTRYLGTSYGIGWP